jgi:hypothetical protein
MRKKVDKLYWVWADMLSRCRNPNHKAFANYGGRGIRVCDAWLNFDRFTADMGQRPEGGSIDRIDNDGNYEPGNCRWATRQEQNSNRRSCILVEIEGETVTLKEACRRKEIGYRAVVKRVQDRNWPIEEALSAPLGLGKRYQRIPSAAA